jgi:hypothetical protein
MGMGAIKSRLGVGLGEWYPAQKTCAKRPRKDTLKSAYLKIWYPFHLIWSGKCTELGQVERCHHSLALTDGWWQHVYNDPIPQSQPGGQAPEPWPAFGIDTQNQRVQIKAELESPPLSPAQPNLTRSLAFNGLRPRICLSFDFFFVASLI